MANHKKGLHGSAPDDEAGGAKTIQFLMKLNPLEDALARAVAEHSGVSRAELFRRLMLDHAFTDEVAKAVGIRIIRKAGHTRWEWADPNNPNNGKVKMDQIQQAQAKQPQRLLAEYSGRVELGIMESHEWSVKLYNDHAMVSWPREIQGSLIVPEVRAQNWRIEEKKTLDALLEIQRAQQGKRAIYTPRGRERSYQDAVFEIVKRYIAQGD